MTPAKQGQELHIPPASYWPQKLEAVWDVDGITCDEEIEVVPAADKQALEKELELCQTYFPFMRRSRDEAVKREKALREALENALAADTESETRHIIYVALDQSGKGARS